MDEARLLKDHNEAVANIQKQVKYFHDNKRHFRIYHGSTSSTRPLNFTRDSIVDVSDMTRVFPVDKASKTIRVEPKIPMDILLAETLKFGLVPEVVMELKGITTGGGFAGLSGESSSFKYGAFHKTCSEIEIVLGDGTVTKASPDHQADLFMGAGGTMGTLGIITLLTIKLIDATSHVDLELRLVREPQDMPAAFEEVIQAGDVDFLDGIYFEKNTAVMMVGKLTNKPSSAVFQKKQVHWFSDEVLKLVTKNKATQTISLRLTDYLFRYDHGAFWGGKLAFKHFHVPNNRITRRLADPWLDSRTCYYALHKSGLANEYLVQDFGMPSSTAPQFISWVTKTLPHLQLFICPVQKAEEFLMTDFFITGMQEKRMDRMIGVGVYGRGPRDPSEFAELNRKLERKAIELVGGKLLYARVYLPEDEFWTAANKASYDALRQKYRAETLPTVYDKIAADMSKIPKLRPVRGILETVFDRARGKTDFILVKTANKKN